MTAYTALVLAGSRGARDPVARHAGLAHKAAVPVAGVPMLSRVLDTLRQAPSVGRIALSADEQAMASLPRVGEAVRAGTLTLTPPAATPGASVAAAVQFLGSPWPLLVVASDHPLLTVAMVEHFCAAAAALDADAAVAVAAGETVRAAYPRSVRTLYRFAGKSYGGCNLFAMRRPAAIGLARYWAELERHRKRPWRLIAAVGPGALARFLLGRLTLEAALGVLSARAGATIGAVVMPFAEAAIDVDRPADLELAETILRRRGAA